VKPAKPARVARSNLASLRKELKSVLEFLRN